MAPRVLEPVISLSLSEDTKELIEAAKYIRELVWCTSINYPRVQFQALWALGNLSQKRRVLPEGPDRAALQDQVAAAVRRFLAVETGALVCEARGVRLRSLLVPLPHPALKRLPAASPAPDWCPFSCA